MNKGIIIFVCKYCGSENIVQRVWTLVNDIIIKSEKAYFPYSYRSGDAKAMGRENISWCDDCNKETMFLTKKRYIEKEKNHDV